MSVIEKKFNEKMIRGEIELGWGKKFETYQDRLWNVSFEGLFSKDARFR